MENKGNSFYGTSLKFLPSEVPQSTYEQYAYYVLAMLCDGAHNHWGKILHLPVFKALLIKNNPELLKCVRDVYREGFHHLFGQLTAMEQKPEYLTQAQIFLNNCMTFLPYFDLNSRETFRIPQWIENQRWEEVEYRIEPILMTSPKKGSHWFTKKSDLYYAYGFVPVDHSTAPCHLLFIGTPHPTHWGCWLGIKSDLQAHKTVGEALYRAGRDVLANWIARQNHEVHALGISLGGSISLLLGIDQGDKIKQVHAYNPAGLYHYKHHNDLDKWSAIKNKPYVRVIRQGNDPVSKLGLHKSEWDIFYLKPTKKKQGKIGILDHALNFAGEADTEFSHINPEDQNHNFRFFNKFVYGYARTALYRAAVLPYHYGVRPFL
ncbi:hypothetical protein [Legionella shakespearei]|uniref:Alpha/beta hydrolase family protein n=1 Tax=Legionella shakespearei DSM 23087 TaxID=1122169 RepID=A0A0W0YIH6_9GAMM|nr:hypothetical protein [Legionella shakespearei]KTD56447.1 hypothetical protein Lsha_2846 [Legionella shakespearei DSM 23087]